jgi:ABC-type nitrate/sulfonate/bicarbonate transport system substrate-binding protein
MKRFLTIVLLCFSALMPILSCARKSKEPSDITVVLDWTPNTNHTGIYAALALDYFKEEGLTVNIVQPPEDGALILVASGGAEFGVDFQESLGVAIAKKDGALPITAIAGLVQHNTSGFMSLAKSGITRPRDLEGKRFASWETPYVNEVVKTLVENDGGDFSKVKMIPNFATDAFSALETDIDTIWIYYGWDGIPAELNRIDIDYLNLATLYPVFDCYTPLLVCNTGYAEKNPETVKKFMRALSMGYNYAIDNPSEAADILLRYAPELDVKLVKASQEYLSPRYREDSPRWGEIDGKRWANFYSWVFDKGLLELDISSRGYTNEYLP